MKRISTCVTRLKHEWRLSTMFPSPQAAMVGQSQGAPADVGEVQSAVEAGSLSQKVRLVSGFISYVSLHVSVLIFY